MYQVVSTDVAGSRPGLQANVSPQKLRCKEVDSLLAWHQPRPCRGVGVRMPAIHPASGWSGKQAAHLRVAILKMFQMNGSHVVFEYFRIDPDFKRFSDEGYEPHGS